MAVVELSSIGRAFTVVDAMVKRAPCKVWRTTPISPGKFLIILTGGVAEVDESYRAGLDAAESFVVDHVFLPNAEPQIARVMLAKPRNPIVDAVGIIETDTCASIVRGADAALKSAEVQLLHLHLGQGIGGKGVMAFSGELYDVQAALEEGVYGAREGHIITREEIPAPHGTMTLAMLGLGSVSPDY